MPHIRVGLAAAASVAARRQLPEGGAPTASGRGGFPFYGLTDDWPKNQARKLLIRKANNVAEKGQPVSAEGRICALNRPRRRPDQSPLADARIGRSVRQNKPIARTKLFSHWLKSAIARQGERTQLPPPDATKSNIHREIRLAHKNPPLQ
jgi:hypothetical protein